MRSCWRRRLSRIRSFSKFILDNFSCSSKFEYLYPQVNQRMQFIDENLLLKLIFPFGIENKYMQMTDSMSQLNEIIFSNYLVEFNPNCFCIAVS